MEKQIRWTCVLWLLVMVIAGQTHADKPAWTTIYRLDTDGRYLEIARDQQGSTHGQKTRHTKAGRRDLAWTCGDCESIFRDIHGRMEWQYRYANLGPSRVVVQTKNARRYSVLFGYDDKAAFKDTADQFGLEVSVEERPVVAWVLESTGGPAPGLQPYRGNLRWPHFKTESRSDVLGNAIRVDRGLCQGAIYYKGDLCYFDGVTFDEFARFVEEVDRIPVVNKTCIRGRYSFTFPMDFSKEFVFGDPPAVLEPIGVKVVESLEEELRVIVVRDAQGNTPGVRPLPEVAVDEPPGPTEQIPELLGRWRVKKATCCGEAGSYAFWIGDLLCCDGRGFLFVDPEGNDLNQWRDFAVWKTIRWGKFYRATRFEFSGGEWDVAERVLLRVHDNTLEYCGFEDVGVSTRFPLDFSPEETGEGLYMVFERVDGMPCRAKGCTRQRPPRRCRHRLRRLGHRCVR